MDKSQPPQLTENKTNPDPRFNHKIWYYWCTKTTTKLLVFFFLIFFFIVFRKIKFFMWSKFIADTGHNKNLIVCWIKNRFCFVCSFKTELGLIFFKLLLLKVAYLEIQKYETTVPPQPNFNNGQDPSTCNLPSLTLPYLLNQSFDFKSFWI